MEYKNILNKEFKKYNINNEILEKYDNIGFKNFKDNQNEIKSKLGIKSDKIFWYQIGGKKKYKIKLTDKYGFRLNIYESIPELEFVNFKNEKWVAFKVNDLVNNNNIRNSKNFKTMQKKFNKLKGGAQYLTEEQIKNNNILEIVNELKTMGFSDIKFEYVKSKYNNDKNDTINKILNEKEKEEEETLKEYNINLNKYLKNIKDINKLDNKELFLLLNKFNSEYVKKNKIEPIIATNTVSNWKKKIENGNEYKIVKAMGDGNCLYHALLLGMGNELANTDIGAQGLRNQLKQYMIDNNKDLIKRYGERNYNTILQRIDKDKEWGEGEEIQIFVNMTDICVAVWCKLSKDYSWVTFTNTVRMGAGGDISNFNNICKKKIILINENLNHYDAIIPNEIKSLPLKDVVIIQRGGSGASAFSFGNEKQVTNSDIPPAPNSNFRKFDNSNTSYSSARAFDFSNEKQVTNSYIPPAPNHNLPPQKNIIKKIEDLEEKRKREQAEAEKKEEKRKAKKQEEKEAREAKKQEEKEAREAKEQEEKEAREAKEQEEKEAREAKKQEEKAEVNKITEEDINNQLKNGLTVEILKEGIKDEINNIGVSNEETVDSLKEEIGDLSDLEPLQIEKLVNILQLEIK